jgi:hypothetical protein
MMHIEYSVLVCKKSTSIQPITSPVEFVARALHFTWIPTIHYLDSQLPIFSCLSDFPCRIATASTHRCFSWTWSHLSRLVSKTEQIRASANWSALNICRQGTTF